MAEIAQHRMSNFILSSMKNQNIRVCSESQYFEVATLRADISITQEVYAQDITDLPRIDRFPLRSISMCLLCSASSENNLACVHLLGIIYENADYDCTCALRASASVASLRASSSISVSSPLSFACMSAVLWAFLCSRTSSLALIWKE